MTQAVAANPVAAGEGERGTAFRLGMSPTAPFSCLSKKRGEKNDTRRGHTPRGTPPWVPPKYSPTPHIGFRPLVFAVRLGACSQNYGGMNYSPTAAPVSLLRWRKLDSPLRVDFA